MKPRGTVRQALSAAACELARERGVGFTWRDLAQHTQVGFAAARQGVKDMVRCGELQRLGELRQAHARRPMTLYAPPAATTGSDALAMLMRTWAR